MSPLLVMLFAAFGPMLAVFDPFGEDTEDEVEDEEIPIGMPDMGTTTGAGMDDALTPDPAEPEAEAPTDVPTAEDPAVETIDHTAQPPEDDAQSQTGTAGDDTLQGTDGRDILFGGQGNDTLSGGVNAQDGNDDGVADELIGEDGDDSLRLGANDTGIGGTGADSFTAIYGATGGITVTDYDVGTDALIVETDDENASVTDQTVADGELTVTLSTGLTITLPGVENPLAEDEILFVLTNPLQDAA
ncbi:MULTISPECIES: type I secretion protein [unclassified Sulfitobacter]|uniref:calcium-binding protein n=1 Tax=unclassified Sulfitobacter TaxID=196795 RepID=UPI0004E38246|nr:MULTISPECIES: type I secretion protein [unclassified Sulfitobacter]PTA98537.1 type I secretion protein [Sulfitobacter sp. CB-A]ULO19338.1 type I secretion protein [Sulfitobacter sp. CB2047]